MLHPWIIKTEIQGEVPYTNLQSNTGYQIRRWEKKNHNLKSQFRREHKKVKESKKVGFPLQSAVGLATNRYYSYSKGRSQEAVEAQIVKVQKLKMN